MVNATRYEEMLRGKLLLFITEMEDEKTIFQRDNVPIPNVPNVPDVPIVELLRWWTLSVRI